MRPARVLLSPTRPEMDPREQLMGDIEALLTLFERFKREGSLETDVAKAATFVLSERRAELARLGEQ